MPIYPFHCSKCNKEFEVKMTMADYQPRAGCPTCKQTSKERIYTDNRTFVYKGNDDITLGHLGSRHRDQFSLDQKQSIRAKQHSYQTPKTLKNIINDVE